MRQQHMLVSVMVVAASFLVFASAPLLVGAAEVWTDSFESGNTVGEFPVGWNILDQDAHTEGTGPRVVDAGAADGNFAVKIMSKPDKKSGKDGRMNRDFEAMTKGVLTLVAMVPSKNSGFLGVELRAEGKRLGNLELHSGGRFRYRDTEGKNQETGIEFDYDTWYQLTIEWDAGTGVWYGSYVDESGEQVQLTPEGGAKFHKDLEGKLPDRVQLRVNRADDGPRVAYVDAFKLEGAE